MPPKSKNASPVMCACCFVPPPEKKKEPSKTAKQQEEQKRSSVDDRQQKVQHQQQQQQQQQQPAANGERDAAATVKPVAPSKGQQQADARAPSKEVSKATQQLQQNQDDGDEIQQISEAPNEPHEQQQQQQQQQQQHSLKQQLSSKQQPPSLATSAAVEKAPQVNRPPPLQPYDSERNTAHDDAASDSDLSDPGEYEKYGPSNSDEDAVDEYGNLIPKEDGLPKGVDTTGVEGGKFTNSGRPAGRYHAAESPLFSDNESQMSDVRQFKSITEMGQAKPKEVLGSSLATAYSHPVTLPKDAGPLGAKTNFAYKNDGDEDDELDDIGDKGQAEGSIKSSNTSSSVDPPQEADAASNLATPQKGMAPGEGQELKGQDSITAVAGTPAAESAPRYASLVPPRTPKDPAPAAGGGEQEQAQGGEDGPPERPAPSVVSQGEASGSSSPRGTPAPRYASLVPPRKKGHSATPSESSIATSELSKHDAGAAAAAPAQSTTSTPPRYASLVPPRRTPKARAPAEPLEQAPAPGPEEPKQEQHEQQKEEQEKEQQAAQDAQRKEQQQKEEQAAQDAQQKEQQAALEAQKKVEEQQQQQQQQREQEQQHEREQQQRQQQKRQAEREDWSRGREEHAPPRDPEAAMHEQADKEGERGSSFTSGSSPRAAAASDAAPGLQQQQQQQQQQQRQEQQQEDGEPSPGGAHGAGAERGEEGAEGSSLTRTASLHSMDQNSRLQARKAEKARDGRGESHDGGAAKPRPAAPYTPGLPRFMQPTVSSEHLLGHHHHQQEQQQQQQAEEHGHGAGRATHARPFSATGFGNLTKGSSVTHSSMASLESAEDGSTRQRQRPRTAEVPGLPRFMQPTAATASLFGQTKEAEARIQAAHEHHQRHHSPSERSVGKSVERRRGAGSTTSLRSSTNTSDLQESGSKAAALAAARPKPDTSHLPRFMQPTVAAQAHTIHGHHHEAGHEKPTHSKFDISALQPEEPDSAAHREEGGGGRGARAGATRSGVPQPARATTPQQQRLQQRGAATSRGSKLPTAEAGSSETPTRPQSARPRAPTDMSSLPRFMQPTAAAMLHQGREIEHEAAPTAKQGASRASAGPGARPGTAPPGGRSPAPAHRTSNTPTKAGAPAALFVAGGGAGQEEAPYTPNNHDQGHSQQQAGAATPPPSGGLTFGEWSLVRLKKQMQCDACKGTARQETVDGETDVFQCDQVLEPKALAVVIAHEATRSEAEGGGTVPKTWVFCPDPLCLDSQPEGSNLPERPPKIQLRGGTKISRKEFQNLKELGLEVGGSTPATTPQADPPTPPTPA